MRRLTRCLTLVLWFAMITFSIQGLAASQLVYVPLDQPCRILDTRLAQGGQGPLSATNGNYVFGVLDSSTATPQQNGEQCGVPFAASAISVNINAIAPTATGNIRAWSTNTSSPGTGIAVYNSQVLYNGGATTIAVPPNYGTFYLSLANGQSDIVLNAIGYWLPISTAAIISGAGAIALGEQPTAQGEGAVAIGSHSTAIGYGAAAYGYGASATAPNAFAEGQGSTAKNYSAIAMGRTADAEGSDSIAMGFETKALGDDSVALGSQNLAVGIFSVAAGHLSSTGGYASFAMGDEAYANGHTAFAMGDTVWATGDGSIALGLFAYTQGSTGVYNNTFVFGDGSTETHNTTSNQFMARAKNGVIFYTSTDTVTGASLSAGSGSWTALSDRNGKTAVERIDGRDVLDRVVSMPLATWQYKTQDAKYRHMGPMAQDFYAAFGLGETDTGIDTIDADGVALAAIQGLNAKVEEKDKVIETHEREIAELRAQVAELTAAIKHPAGAASP